MLAVGGVEAEFVGEVIAEKHGQAPAERQVLHHAAHRAALVGTHRDELDHMVARLQAIAGTAAHVAVGEGTHLAGRVRSAAPMQRQADALVFHQYAGMAMGETHRLLVQGVQPLGGIVVVRVAQHAAGLGAQFVAVQAGGRQLQRCKQLVQLFKRATTDQCHGTFQAVADAADGFTHIRQQLHGIRACSEFDQGAVDIEEQRAGVVQQWRWRTQGKRFSHDAQLASVGVYVGSRSGYESG
ncbi:hypothetical protein G6F22_017633 [Rhizopus arrhizus]|nr:hypothetical protein G6F22_017633 [Rhizopus arrhizus]